MIEQPHIPLESSESSGIDQQLASLFQELTQQVEEVRSTDSELAKQLDQVVVDLRDLHLETVNTTLQQLDLPEQLALLVEQIHQHLEQKLQQLADKIEADIPSDTASQAEKDAYIHQQARHTQQQLAQQTITTLTHDMGQSQNYYQDPLSQGVAWLLGRISTVLKDRAL